MDLKPGRVEAY